MPSSADANPEVRRRAVASMNPRVNGEVNADGNEKALVNGENQGESNAAERSRDGRAAAVMAAETPTLAYHRRKKSAPRPETPKPKWVTVLSILTKLCLLILGLVWLGKMVLQLSNANGSTTGFPFNALDQDGRISELESLMKKTAKVFQVQLDVVDKKIGNEIAAVREELTKKVEEKGGFLEEGLKKLEARTEELGKSLGELKYLDLLTKEEFEGFKTELKKRRLVGEDVSLDDIRALAREIVEKEIEKHAADGLGRPDYALASAGAKVTMHSEPFVSGKAWFTIGSTDHPNAQKMLEPSFGEPGQCFALRGSSGFVEIRLRTAIIPQAVTLEHVAKSVAYDRSSAPKDCIVSAWFDVPGEPRNTEVLTNFSYDLAKSNAQTFDVEKTDIGVVNMVRLDFTSNHGSPLTCIYRLRVHGYENGANEFEYSHSLEGEKNIGQR